MNQYTRYVLGIYQVGLILRESLEYGVHKEKYEKKTYDYRKATLKNCMAENSPIMTFLSRNGETGEKIRNNLNDFVDLVYGDEARVVAVEGDNIRVDTAFANQVFDYVVGLHETISDITLGFVNNAKKNENQENNYEEYFEEFLKKDDLFYRSIASLVLTNEMHRLFVEFNKTMQEAKGKENAQSNFVVSDLKKVIGYYNFVQEHSKIEFEKYKHAVESSKHVINCMLGQEKPAEGSNLQKEIVALREEWVMVCQISEVDWNYSYKQIIQDVTELEAKMREEATQNKAAEN